MKLLEDSIRREYLPVMLTLLVILAVMLYLADAASAQVGSAGGNAPAVVAAETATPAAPAPRLTQADIESLADVVTISNTAAQELNTARLYLEAAERKSESIVYYSAAKRLRILAKMSLDPDLWDIQLVSTGPEGRQRQEWQLVALKPKEGPPVAKEKPTP